MTRDQTEAAILNHLSDKYQNSQGITNITITFPSSLLQSKIEFYEIELGRLVVIAKYQLPKKDCYSLKGPKEFTNVTHLLNAIEQIDPEFREKIELLCYRQHLGSKGKNKRNTSKNYTT